MDIPNPPETERVWLTALEDANRKGNADVRTMTQKGRALMLEEIEAVLNYLHALDQYFCRYVPTADALSGLGRPSLAQAWHRCGRRLTMAYPSTATCITAP